MQNQWINDVGTSENYCKSSNSIATFIIFPIQVAKHGGITVYPQFLRNQLDMGVIDPDVHEAFDPSQGGIVSFFSFSGYTPWLFNIAMEKDFFFKKIDRSFIISIIYFSGPWLP